MKGLTDLSLETAKIEALQQSLNALAKDTGFLAKAEEAEKFAADLKDQVDLNTCSAALHSQQTADRKIDDLDAAIADPAKAFGQSRQHDEAGYRQRPFLGSGEARKVNGEAKGNHGSRQHTELPIGELPCRM